jgi:hypothetical protein
MLRQSGPCPMFGPRRPFRSSQLDFTESGFDQPPILALSHHSARSSAGGDARWHRNRPHGSGWRRPVLRLRALGVGVDPSGDATGFGCHDGSGPPNSTRWVRRATTGSGQTADSLRRQTPMRSRNRRSNPSAVVPREGPRVHQQDSVGQSHTRVRRNSGTTTLRLPRRSGPA